jgi:pilus assembly protein Flp/PilA
MLALYTRISTELRSRLSRDEEGATAVEYGLIVGLIAVAIVAAMTVFTGALDGAFDRIAGVLGGNTAVTD